ncbi:NOG1 family protein [Methanocella sp. MCL-LM]|uniref:NOG1 family protein n=1 Tax=Methanocella sp. MCL-LM TaxID=3412035 RepID=UPI003C737088
MIFEKIHTILTADELVDKAFSRSVRAGRGKIGGEYTDKREIEESMVITAGNILGDNLRNAVKDWPNLDRLEPFYREMADILVGVDELKMKLSSVSWASEKSRDISRKYVGMIRKSPDPALLRKQAFGRMASIAYDVDKDLRFLNDARNKLRQLPEIKDEPTIVVAGYPNVGKSSFVAAVTGAKPEIAPYPFTTKGIVIGHFTKNKIRYQVIDTPGLLDRPLEKRNDIELQAIAALRHVGNVLLFIIDPSETCGFTLEEQEELLKEVKELVKMPVVTVANKIDVEHSKANADLEMSTLKGEGVAAVKQRLVEMIEKIESLKPPQPPEEKNEEEGEVHKIPPSRKKKKEKTGNDENQ